MGDIIDLDARRAGLRVLLEFDSDAPEFARGFEAGRLHAKLESHGPDEAMIHASNRIMAERIAEAEGYDVAFRETEDAAWIVATFTQRSRR